MLAILDQLLLKSSNLRFSWRPNLRNVQPRWLLLLSAYPTPDMFVHRAELWQATDSKRAAKFVSRLCQAAGQLYAANDREVHHVNVLKKSRSDLIQIQGAIPFPNAFSRSNTAPVAAHTRTSKGVIQSLTSCSHTDNYWLLSCDDYGKTIKTKHDASHNVIESCILNGSTVRQAGGYWKAVSHPSSQHTAVLSTYNRSLELFECEKSIAVQYLQDIPRDVCAATMPVDEENVPAFFVAEGYGVAVFKTDGTLIRREVVSQKPLYCLTIDGNYLACAGQDRTVMVLDLRSWTVVGTWRSALKYAISLLTFGLEPKETTDDKPRMLFTGSTIDSELSSGMWGKNIKASRHSDERCYRGESRWLGMIRDSESNDVWALSANGHVYLLENFDKLAGKSDAAEAGVKRQADDDDGDLEGEQAQQRTKSS